MAKGWHITFVGGDGKTQVAKVAIEDQEQAIKAATKGRSATGIVALPLKDGEYESLALTEGQVMYSTRID